MNVERLHNILFQVKKDLDQSDLVNVFNDLIQSMKQLINDPNSPPVQEGVSNARVALKTLLDDHVSNSYPPSWVAALEEMELNWFIASELQEMVAETFEGSKITPASTAKTLDEIYTQFVEDVETVKKLITSLISLKIGREILKPGESEVSVSIPHKEIDGDLVQFGKEIGEIEKMFRPFAEVATNSPQDLKIKSISSSSLVVTFLIAAPTIILAAKTVKAIAEAVSAVIEGYLKVQKLREVKGTLKSFSGSEKLVIGTQELAQTIIDEEINLAANKIVKENKKISRDRRNELENSLRINMKAMAYRIDHGWYVETRMGEVPKPDPEDKTNEGKDKKELFKSFDQIKHSHKQQLMFEPESEPILALPKPKLKTPSKKRAKSKTSGTKKTNNPSKLPPANEEKKNS